VLFTPASNKADAVMILKTEAAGGPGSVTTRALSPFPAS
jgi:hypothetical protein